MSFKQTGSSNKRHTKQRQTERDGANKKRPRKFFVHFDRKTDIQNVRAELPVCMHEQEIIEAIHAYDVVLVTGATGTGKTTQVPQFLLEDGFGDLKSPCSSGMIAVTQPRRIAALSCAKRVAFEINSEVGDIVGYQIRHDAKFGPNTKIKFATDGVLLREVENDLLLQKYSAIIIDEVHERSVNTDLLLSFLSRSIIMRKERETELGRLKVIVMSATLDVDDVFSGEDALFPNPPVINVPSRQFPVTMHFAKKTMDNYVDEAYRKVSKIHRRLPQGGILVFLSGRQEVEQLCSQLREEFETKKISVPDSDGARINMQVLPFYALLPDHLQRKIFDDYGDGTRKVVIATNVAETSVTVPGIAYIVDSGRVKEKIYKGKGLDLMTSFEVRWVSQASAEQRAGRAGRTGPGHAYRLYSSAVYSQQFAQFRQPEIRRVPADSLVLRLRAMGIRHVHKFPFPTKPNQSDLLNAEKLLTDLGALYSSERLPSLKLDDGLLSKRSSNSSVILGVTQIGRDLAKLPLPPRFGRFLLTANAFGMAFPYACRIAAVLTVGTVLNKSIDNFKEKHCLLRHRRSDLMTELAAVCAVEHVGNRVQTASKNPDIGAMRILCHDLGLHLKSILEVISVCRQVGTVFGKKSNFSSVLKPPNGVIEKRILRSFLSGFPDHVARRMTRREAAALGVIPRRQRLAFTVASHEGPVFLESSSSVRLDTNVEFVCFSELVEVHIPKKKALQEEIDDYSESDEDNGMKIVEDGEANGEEEKERATGACKEMESRVVMRGATVVEAGWIVEEATGMCHFGRASETVEAEYDARLETIVERVPASYGKHRWPLGMTAVPVNLLQRLQKRSDHDHERRRAYCVAFSRALLTGKVRKELGVGFRRDEKQMLEISVRAVSEVLELHDVVCVAGLKKMIQEKGDVLTGLVQACVGRRGEAVGDVWKCGIADLVEELESEEEDSEDEESESEE